MNRKRIFESIYNQSKRPGIKFSEFKQLLERTDFSDVDDKKLSDMLLWGDRSTLLDQDKSLMQALNIDVDDELLMPKIAGAVPAYGGLFSQGMQEKAKAIDLVNSQLDYIKAAITAFEAKFVSSITGKEEGDVYKSNILGISGIAGDVNISQQLVNKIAEVFSTVSSAPLKPSIDAFVESQEGKKLISLLEEIGANAGTSGTERIINDVLGKAVKQLASRNIQVAMNAADNTDLEEITNESALFGVAMNYISEDNDLSEMELMSSMDPFVRMGMFYHLAILQDEAFMDRIMPATSGMGVNYSGLMSSGKMNDESLKILFGRNVKTASVQDVLTKLDAISIDIVDLLWSGAEAEETRATLFIPAMQAFYIALLNYVVMKGLYVYLTKKTVIVAKTRAEREEAAKKAAESVSKTPGTMTDLERGKKIQEIFRGPKLKEMLSDNTIYIAGRKGYDAEKVKALKELVYYTFGHKNSEVESVKNWNVAQNPLDGNYDDFFAGMIKDIQRTYDVRPIDGKVGPITKEWFNEIVPVALVELL